MRRQATSWKTAEHDEAGHPRFDGFHFACVAGRAPSLSAQLAGLVGGGGGAFAVGVARRAARKPGWR